MPDSEASNNYHSRPFDWSESEAATIYAQGPVHYFSSSEALPTPPSPPSPPPVRRHLWFPSSSTRPRLPLPPIPPSPPLTSWERETVVYRSDSDEEEEEADMYRDRNGLANDGEEVLRDSRDDGNGDSEVDGDGEGYTPLLTIDDLPTPPPTHPRRRAARTWARSRTPDADQLYPMYATTSPSTRFRVLPRSFARQASSRPDMQHVAVVGDGLHMDMDIHPHPNLNLLHVDLDANGDPLPPTSRVRRSDCPYPYPYTSPPLSGANLAARRVYQYQLYRSNYHVHGMSGVDGNGDRVETTGEGESESEGGGARSVLGKRRREEVGWEVGR